jgi:hypothetical protein
MSLPSILQIDGALFRHLEELKARGSVITVEAMDVSQVSPETNILRVENCPEKETSESLKLLLENKRMSNGGPIDFMECIGDGQYMVQFSSCAGQCMTFSYNF